jgi:hypothetical protein
MKVKNPATNADYEILDREEFDTEVNRFIRAWLLFLLLQ